jgi:hypothetical protein
MDNFIEIFAHYFGDADDIDEGYGGGVIQGGRSMIMMTKKYIKTRRDAAATNEQQYSSPTTTTCRIESYYIANEGNMHIKKNIGRRGQIWQSVVLNKFDS